MAEENESIDWEALLKKEWLGDIDETDWFVSERELFKNKYDEIIKYIPWNLKDIVENIEKENNILIKLNPKKSSIEIYSSENLLIWKMEKTLYNSKDFSTKEHLMIEIESRFRWMWFWKIMYETYEKIASIDKNFILPEQEYAVKASTINLYRKFWFEPTKKIIDYKEYDFWEDDLIELENILENIRNWNWEKAFDFTVKMEKINTN